MSVLLSVNVILALIPPERCFTPSLDKGLVFLNEGDILLTNDKWTLVVNIDVTEYDGMIEYMLSLIHI